MKLIKCHTDGACNPNPGVGGWGVVIDDGIDEKYAFGGHDDTTNNQMELEAAIQALLRTPDKAVIKVYTDSKFVIGGITQWMKSWKKNGWTTSNGKPVKNQSYWERLDRAVSKKIGVKWEWVKGHSGDRGNEIADTLAVNGLRKAKGLTAWSIDEVLSVSQAKDNPMNPAISSKALNMLRETMKS